MKTKLALIAVACLLLGLTVSASTQNDMDAARQQMHYDIAKQEMLHIMLSGYNVNTELVDFLGMSYIREGLGLSQEQIQTIQREVQVYIHPTLENDPDFISLQEEMRKFNPDHPEATEETLKQYTNLRVQWEAMRRENKVNIFYGNLTPEQIRKLQEFHIATMSETEYVFPGMFEALDLSDEQKKQLDEIQKEMKPEFGKHIDRMFEYRLRYDEKIQGRYGDSDFALTILAKLQPEKDAVMASGRELADNLKIEMFDVLTDEQWNRMIDLIDNPPVHARRWLERIRERREAEAANAPAGGWVPGPGSWHPGDPIPGAYRIERETRSRFPRGEN